MENEPLDDLPNDTENEAPDQSSFQEDSSVPENMIKTIPLIGKAPLVCKSCKDIRFSKDLTRCPLCGSSSVVKAAIVHYVEPCEKEDHDSRYHQGKSTAFKTGSFRIPCQSDSSSRKERPSNITATLDSVTCPRCIHAVGGELSSNGTLLNFEES
jgi:hypothetical protein